MWNNITCWLLGNFQKETLNYTKFCQLIIRFFQCWNSVWGFSYLASQSAMLTVPHDPQSQHRSLTAVNTADDFSNNDRGKPGPNWICSTLFVSFHYSSDEVCWNNAVIVCLEEQRIIPHNIHIIVIILAWLVKQYASDTLGNWRCACLSKWHGAN